MSSQPKPNEVNAFNSAQELLHHRSEREAEAALALACAANAKQDIEMAQDFQAVGNDGLCSAARRATAEPIVRPSLISNGLFAIILIKLRRSVQCHPSQ